MYLNQIQQTTSQLILPNGVIFSNISSDSDEIFEDQNMTHIMCDTFHTYCFHCIAMHWWSGQNTSYHWMIRHVNDLTMFMSNNLNHNTLHHSKYVEYDSADQFKIQEFGRRCNKVPNSGLGPKWDQSTNMVPKKSRFCLQVPNFWFYLQMLLKRGGT